jgi:CubicO group peptidase (beta-lactamase class C family)
VPPSDELERLVRDAQARHRLPGIDARVVVRGQPVLELAIGVADAAGRAAEPGMQYRIGSITKTFTAAAVMTLVDEGVLGLDDLLGEHVAEAGDRPLTIRRLLSHSSGLQREPIGDGWKTYEFPSLEELLAKLDEAEQVLEPASYWHYSNLAYSLLGVVVTLVSGRPYREMVTERFLRPLGLERTWWDRIEPAANGYYVDPFSNVLRPEPVLAAIEAFSGAGDLWSTTEDLCRWGALLAGREQMHSVQVMAEPRRWQLAWGLGLMLHRRGDRIFFGHDGAMPGYLGSLLCSRDEDVQICVLTNASTPSSGVTELALALVEAAVDLYPRSPAVWQPEQAPPDEIDEILGSWWSEFVFRWRAGRLEAAMSGSSWRATPSVFERVEADRYRVAEGRERGELLEVVRDEDGEVLRMYLAGYPFTRHPEGRAGWRRQRRR